MTCKQCKHIDRCMSEASSLGQVFDPDYDGEHSCPEFDAFTNADRIRAMSDEELAWAIDPAIVPPGMPKREWLKQPAEASL